MLEFILEKDCCNYDYINNCLENLKEYITSIVNTLNIKTLSYFVVADGTEDNFTRTIYKYSEILEGHTSVTNNESYQCAGKSIEGINQHGEYQQAIIIKSGLIKGCYYDLLILNGFKVEDEIYSSFKNIGLSTITHELGHAIDNQNIYYLLGKVNNKITFNLDSEYDEYISREALSLWGEYYAEFVSFKLVSDLNNDLKEEMLIDCIKTYMKTDKIERVYRIAYLFFHCLSYYNATGKENNIYGKYQNDKELIGYVPYLKGFELAIINLHEKYPQWNMSDDLNELTAAINDMMHFEKTS